MIVFALIYVCAAFGLAAILGHGAITAPARDALLAWGEPRTIAGLRVTIEADWTAVPRWTVKWMIKLIECPMCLGFWTGLFAGRFFFVLPWVEAFVLAFATSGSNTTLALVTGLTKPPE